MSSHLGRGMLFHGGSSVNVPVLLHVISSALKDVILYCKVDISFPKRYVLKDMEGKLLSKNKPGHRKTTHYT